MMSKADLSRVLQAFKPDLPETLHARLWLSLGKEQSDTLTYDEFRDAFGPRAAPPPPVLPLSRGRSSEAFDEGANTMDSFLSPSGNSVSSTTSVSSAPEDRSPADQRRARVLYHRFGRAVVREENLKADLLRMRSPRRSLGGTPTAPGLNTQDVLQAFYRHGGALSKGEVESFMWLWSHDGSLRPEVVKGAEAEAETVPPEVPWARQAIASAGVAARADGAVALATLLAGLGQVAEPQEIRKLVQPHSSLDEEGWETLFLTLDKKYDGKVIMEPLVQWAVGIGVGGDQVAPQVITVNEMFASPQGSPRSEAGESNASSFGDEASLPREELERILASTSGLRPPISSSVGIRKLSSVQEDDEFASDDASVESFVKHRRSPTDEDDENALDDEDLFAPLTISFGSG